MDLFKKATAEMSDLAKNAIATSGIVLDGDAEELAGELTDDEIVKATEIVNKQIEKYREQLQKIAKTECGEPVMVEGETKTGYYCQLMVDPAKAAKIMLDHDYPTYATLWQDAPDKMWQALADEYGLDSVSSIDL